MIYSSPSTMKILHVRLISLLPTVFSYKLNSKFDVLLHEFSLNIEFPTPTPTYLTASRIPEQRGVALFIASTPRCPPAIQIVTSALWWGTSRSHGDERRCESIHKQISFPTLLLMSFTQHLHKSSMFCINKTSLLR